MAEPPNPTEAQPAPAQSSRCGTHEGDGRYPGRNEILPGAEPALTNVGVPDPFIATFLKAQDYVERYFLDKKEMPHQGVIDISGERYILVRAASMSKEFFDLMTSLYQDRGAREARNVTFGFLFDMAHAIGKADARSFFAKMGVVDPIDRLSAGPIHFAHTGWAFVTILPESSPTPDENYYLIYDHPFSFEASTWLKDGKRTDFPVCIMNAGYSSGWCEESFGISLVAAEIQCRSKGDRHCRFIMAPPDKIKAHIARYSDRAGGKPVDFGTIDIPEFFKRKRLEDELRRHRNRLEELVAKRTDRLTQINRRLERREAQLEAQSRHMEEVNIALKVVLKQVEEKRKEDKENFLTNVKQLVVPYLDRLKRKRLKTDEMKLVQTLEANLNNITSPLIGKLSSNFLDLTPVEIRIAHLVKEGLTNKEIADLMRISLNTVSSHRYHIRTKLGLKKQGANLRSYLLSLEK